VRSPKERDIPKRLLIVGGVAAGASAAAKARRSSEDIEIVMLERGPYMSFADCGLPYYIGGEIQSRSSLLVADPGIFTRRFRVDVRLETTVTEVDTSRNSVSFTDRYGHSGSLEYDRLILATGTVPVKLPLEGIDAPNIFLCRTVPDADAIREYLEAVAAQARAHDDGDEGLDTTQGRALIIGAGYVGLECAEQLLARGLDVTVVEALDQVMSPLDREMTLPIQQALEAAGAELILEDQVEGSIHPDPKPCSRAAGRWNSTWRYRDVGGRFLQHNIQSRRLVSRFPVAANQAGLCTGERALVGRPGRRAGWGGQAARYPGHGGLR